MSELAHAPQGGGDVPEEELQLLLALMLIPLTFGFIPTQPLQVDDVGKVILQSLQKGKGLSTQELADAIGLLARATRLRLIKLVNQGLVWETGTSLQDPIRRYHPARK